MRHIWYTTQTEETQNLAIALAQVLRGGELITLRGDLGAGKTTFTQGLARGLGITKAVKSPTFTLIREYQGQALKLNHMDLYRVEDQYEELGLEEYFNQQESVTVIEWPEQMGAQIPDQHLDLAIRLTPDGDREIEVNARGTIYEALLTKWLGQLEGGEHEG